MSFNNNSRIFNSTPFTPPPQATLEARRGLGTPSHNLSFSFGTIPKGSSNRNGYPGSPSTPKRIIQTPMTRRYSLSDVSFSSPLVDRKSKFQPSYSTPSPGNSTTNKIGAYIDGTSPGFAGRIVQYHDETTERSLPICQAKYGSPGVFPIVHLFKKDLPPPERKTTKVTVRLGPSEYSRNTPEHNRKLLEQILQPVPPPTSRPHVGATAEGNTKSVLDALKEISRKRIRSTDEEVDTAGKKSRLESPGEVKKRGREETSPKSSPPNKAMKFCITSSILASETSTNDDLLPKSTKAKIRTPSPPKLVSVETQTVEKTPRRSVEVQAKVESIRRVHESGADAESKDQSSDDEEVSHRKDGKVCVPLQVFDEKPLEMMRRHRLEVLLKLKPMGPNLEKKKYYEEKLRRLGTKQETSNNSKTPEKPLVSILSNSLLKSPHAVEKHVTFNIPDSENSTSSESIPATQPVTEEAPVKEVAETPKSSPEKSLTDITNTHQLASTPSVPTFNFSPPTSSVATAAPTFTPVIVSSESDKTFFTPTVVSSTSAPKSDVGSPSLSHSFVVPSSGGSIPTSDQTFTPPPSLVVSPTSSAVKTTSDSSQGFWPKTPPTLGSFITSQTPFTGPPKPSAVAPKFNFGSNNPSPVTTTVTSNPSTFGTTTTTSSAQNLFGVPTSKDGFGAPSVPATTVAEVAKPSNIFGASKPPVATTTTSGIFSSSFGAPTTSTTPFTLTSPAPNIFGGAGDAKPPGFAPSFTSGSSTSSGLGVSGASFSSATPTSSFGQTTTTTPSFVPPTSTTKAPSFGAVTTASFNFGAPTASTTANPAFGYAVPSFATTTSAPGSAFGSAATAPSFGGASTTTGAFGSTAVPSFGHVTTTAPGFGSSATTTTAFGVATTTAAPVFGVATTTAAPVFGVATTTAAPAFGSTSVPNFGTSTTPSGFGGATTTTAPAFGSTAVPNFGAVTSTPGFGGATTTTAPPFGSTAVQSFGAATTAPGFGAATTTTAPTFGLTFGSVTTAPSFGGASTTTSAFGSTAVPSFGAIATTASSGFATTTAPFGAAATLPSFGAVTTTAPNFGAFGAPTTAVSSFGSGAFGAPTTTAPPSYGASLSFGAVSKPGGSFGAAAPNVAPFATGFGAAAPNFGAPSANNSGFGATAPSFGASKFAAPNGFGAPASSSPFGASAGQGFGAAAAPSAPSFGASSTPSFGSSSTPSFGAAAPTSSFGQPQSGSAFSFGGGSFAKPPAQSPFAPPAYNQSGSGFGAAPPAQNGLFTFGSTQSQGQQQQSSTAPKAGVFSFGAAEAPKATFNFTGGASTAGAVPPFGSVGAQQFGAPGAPGMFNIGTSSTPSAKSRTQLKAKRRT